MGQFEERLNKILPRITSKELLSNAGLGNEIGFYIFDYPPENELQVREHIQFLLSHLEKKYPHIRVKHINLFELIINYLKSRNLYERVVKIDREKGTDEVLKALQAPLSADNIAKTFSDAADPQNHDLVIVSGVGSAWPLLRSHNLLNNLHPIMGSTPLVMFYPGVFTGQGLRLFSRLKENNYYRAFQLVP